MITDYVTFAYLTDVYVLDEYQGWGLGSWLIGCVQEFFESMPHLRRSMLVTGSEWAQRYYEKRMKMGKVEGKAIVMAWKGPGAVF